MLAIRLQRNGRTHLPVYRIIVQEAQRHPLSGRVVAEVGHYNPHTKETVLDKEAVNKYLSNGAQPSTRVARILQAEGIKLPKWVKLAPQKQAKAKHADKLRKNQPKEEPAAEAPAEATEAAESAPETTEAPAEAAAAPEEAPAAAAEATPETTEAPAEETPAAE